MQKIKNGVVVIAAIALALAGVGIAGMAAAHADVIKERQAGFSGNQSAMKKMGGAIPSGDTAVIAAEAKKIADWAARMTEYFPPGSFEGKTDALPSIRDEWDKFTALASANGAAARELAALADAGDVFDLDAAFGKLGGTCKTCHQNFKK